MLTKDSQQNTLLQLFSLFCCCHTIMNPKIVLATRQRWSGFGGLVDKALNGDLGDLGSAFRSD